MPGSRCWPHRLLFSCLVYHKANIPGLSVLPRFGGPFFFALHRPLMMGVCCVNMVSLCSGVGCIDLAASWYGI